MSANEKWDQLKTWLEKETKERKEKMGDLMSPDGATLIVHYQNVLNQMKLIDKAVTEKQNSLILAWCYSCAMSCKKIGEINRLGVRKSYCCSCFYKIDKPMRVKLDVCVCAM